MPFALVAAELPTVNPFASSELIWFAVPVPLPSGKVVVIPAERITAVCALAGRMSTDSG